MASRIITINMRKYLSTQPRTRRIKRSMRYLRERIAHYTKTDEANVRISDELNKMMFKHYIKSMKPVKVSVEISEGITKVGLFKDATKPTSAQAQAHAAPSLNSASPHKEKAAQKEQKEPKGSAAKPAVKPSIGKNQKSPSVPGAVPGKKQAAEGATQK